MNSEWLCKQSSWKYFFLCLLPRRDRLLVWDNAWKSLWLGNTSLAYLTITPILHEPCSIVIQSLSIATMHHKNLQSRSKLTTLRIHTSFPFWTTSTNLKDLASAVSRDQFVKVNLVHAHTKQGVTYICVDVISNHRWPIRRLSLAVGWTGHSDKRKLAVTDKGHTSEFFLSRMGNTLL